MDGLHDEHQRALAEASPLTAEQIQYLKGKGVDYPWRPRQTYVALQEVDTLREELIEAYRTILALATPTTGDHEEAAQRLSELTGEQCTCGYCKWDPEEHKASADALRKAMEK